ncbi:hypothetical protein PTKIN_Ptkin07bG0277800 [Pterospermum kingtungense]
MVVSKQLVVLIAAGMLVAVLFAHNSQGRPINYSSLKNHAPPCSEMQPENCVTKSPPVNEHRNDCKPSNGCRIGEAQVSSATKQSGVLPGVQPPS